ncbi:SDR family oxidoreductase [uncultured Ilyobacter sp.]|uniref:SDR family oxidoreductase n=1 Tax=uncultured Ilyobacter sp. TaxID=544433 RepID=UPI0029F4C383|nr:SDR family oxidoreductase [uncultured Ilyobacter sp.]
MKLFDLTGKKAIVTGSNRGMGFSIAKGLYEAGAKVVLIDINEEVHNSAKKLDPTGKNAFGVTGDMSKIEGLDGIFNSSMDNLEGEVDILVNCAGISRRGDLENFDLEVWDNVMTVNSSSVFFLSQLAGKKMLEKGSGKIINIASMLSFNGSAGSIAYATSKAAVASITKSLCIGWGSKGVNVNAIAPGWIQTDLTAALRANTEKTDTISKRIPMDRWGTPEDVVGTAIFLASDASNYVNGAIIPVDGGYLAF